MVQYDTDLCVCTVSVLTLMGNTLVLQLTQGEYMVMYRPLAPVSAISVSLELILGGGLHLWIVEVGATIIFLLMLTLLEVIQTSLLYL